MDVMVNFFFEYGFIIKPVIVVLAIGLVGYTQYKVFRLGIKTTPNDRPIEDSGIFKFDDIAGFDPVTGETQFTDGSSF